MILPHSPSPTARLCALVLATGILHTPISDAKGGLRLAQTRVVFDAQQSNAKAIIINNSPQVYLVKASVMNTPDVQDMTASPFMVTPPLFRLEPESQHTALVVRQGATQLPADRESVFYLSFLAIPASAKTGEPEENMTMAQISIGIRNIIKLFYRPAALPMNAETAYSKLSFRQAGGRIEVSNPTPYYVTLAQVTINKQLLDVGQHDPMIAPFSQQSYPFTGRGTQVEWSAITDFGDMSPRYQGSLASKGEGK
ncbi:molecular chaperone [Klebsiella sp. BIGb0407]|uniref:fimbrial biogenesis chaperone n=1 Tax=Klebsiella sp. BIGb0407 TaxID=2940603 RepID=UPI0021694F1B|nr:molecular chaperone [Klebsiella sp. BIGb0407]MCS3433173.1 P pilus assembly chaperone PapD [Klebsiella sp. BIGb0407]